MNMRFLYSVLGLLLIMASPWTAQAGLLEETCALVYKKLGSGPYENLTKSIETFANDGKPYRGCVIHFYGNANKVMAAHRQPESPESLFGSGLSICPDGKRPSKISGERPNEDEWCGDQMADGADGTSYRAFKKNIFCAVEAEWEGGNDNDTGKFYLRIDREKSYAQSLRYEVIVQCANR